MAEKTLPDVVEDTEEPQRTKDGNIGLFAVRCAVNPASSIADLAHDFECLFGSALGALETIGAAACDTVAVPPEVHEPWYAMAYTIRQARTTWAHLYERIG